VEFFLDKYEGKLIIKTENSNIFIPLSQIDYIKEGIIVKRFLKGFFTKNKDLLIGFFSNFGLNYLYYINIKEGFKIVTIKLKDFFINYLIISIPKDFFFLLKSLKEEHSYN